jgi:ABC-type uncharacterized transport system substrate-binding protein
MLRRRLLVLVGGAPLLSTAAAWSAEKVGRVGFLIPTSPAGGQDLLNAVRDEFKKLGWVEGRNLQLDVRYAADNDPEGRVGKELLALRPDAIIVGGTPLIALHKATQTMPIVFASIYDPVGNGVVTNLAHPGGNVTGFPQPDTPVIGKELELLKEIAPQITRIVVLVGGANYPKTWQEAAESAAHSLGLTVSAARIDDAASIERVISQFAAKPRGGLVSLPSGVAGANRKLIVDLAAQYRLPAIYPGSFYTNIGGLMSYGVDFLALYRNAAGYADRILRGAKPGDLPIQYPTKFELAINLKTAKALELTVPPALLSLSDRVIE